MTRLRALRPMCAARCAAARRARACARGEWVERERAAVAWRRRGQGGPGQAGEGAGSEGWRGLSRALGAGSTGAEQRRKKGGREKKKEKEIEEKKMGGEGKEKEGGGGARQRRLRPRSATRVRATGDGARGREGRREGKRRGGIRGGRSRRVALDGKKMGRGLNSGVGLLGGGSGD